MRNYLVTLTKTGHSYYVNASSAESAKQIVLDFEPYYNRIGDLRSDTTPTRPVRTCKNVRVPSP